MTYIGLAGSSLHQASTRIRDEPASLCLNAFFPRDSSWQ